MIDLIEQEIIERLQDKWAEHGSKLAVFDIGKDWEDIIAPQAAVSVATERIGLRKIVNGTFEIMAHISVYVAFKNVSSGKGRRQGVYSIVMGVIAILVGQDLDLEIDYLMPDGSADEQYHQNLKDKGMIGFKIPLKTSFDIDQLDSDEVSTALISEGLSYHLETDAVTNATDEITYATDDE